MNAILGKTDHRPYPLPKGPWRLSQRWNDLLFAHWPVMAAQIAPHLPGGLELDTFEGTAWVGIVPFWMDRIRTRAVGQTGFLFPGVTTFPELNLRTYVRSRITGRPGVYFFSLDAGNLLAVLGARMLFHLPYFWSRIDRSLRPGGWNAYASTRLLPGRAAHFDVRYRPLGPAASPSTPGTLVHFLTERYCLYTTHRNQIQVGNIHHLPWPLQPAEAEIRGNDLAETHGIVLPKQEPLLHFSKALEVYLWPLSEEV